MDGLVYPLVKSNPVAAAQLADALARLAELPLDHLPEPADWLRASRVPTPANALCVGRDEALLALARLLMASEAVAGPAVALTGPSGIGKTQLAHEFERRYGQYFAGGVFWVSFTTADGIPSEIAAAGLAAAMDLRQPFVGLNQDMLTAAVLSQWQDGLPRLLVFDDCDNAELLAKWRPPSGACRVLLTSRQAEWDQAAGVPALALGGLTAPASVALLRTYRPDLGAGKADLAALASALGHVPLALHLAGSHLRANAGSPPGQLLAELGRPKLLDQWAMAGSGQDEPPTPHQAAVAQIFAIKWNELQMEDALDALARQALACAACMAPGQAIPPDLLWVTLRVDYAEPPHSAQALQRLLDLGLLASDVDGALRLQPVLAALGAQWGLTEGVFETAARNVLDELKLWLAVSETAPLLPWQAHLHALASQAAQRNSAWASELNLALGGYLQRVGANDDARSAYERALQIVEANAGPQDPRVARILGELGTLLLNQLDDAGARAAFERALKIDEAAFGADQPPVDTDANNLGLALLGQTGRARARADYERHLKFSDELFDGQPLNSAMEAEVSLHSPQAQASLAGARAAFERSLAVSEALYGRNEPSQAMTLSNLGVVMQAQGDLAGAQAALERAVQLLETVYGPEDGIVASFSRQLALVLQDQGDLLGARAALERTLRIELAANGPASTSLGAYALELGRVLFALGDLAGAQTQLEHGLRIEEMAYGADSPLVLMVVRELARVLQARGDWPGCQAALRRVLTNYELTFGPEHANTRAFRAYLASLTSPADST